MLNGLIIVVVQLTVLAVVVVFINKVLPPIKREEMKDQTCLKDS